jgi:hypothetical protein
MAVLLDLLLVLIFVVVPVAAICMQNIPARLADVTFRDTAPGNAWHLVGQYAEGTFEQRFGYPTGYFQVDDKGTKQAERLVMREAQPAGAITDGCALQVGALGLSGFEDGITTGCLMFMAVAFVGAPFFIVSTLDRFFRFALRSRVDVRFTRSGPDTIASFAFYGPGGYALRSRYAQAFAKPELPTALTEIPVQMRGQAPAGLDPRRGVA